MALRIAELETVFTANVQDFEKKTDQVDKTSKTLEKSNPTVKVGADEKPALAGLDRVISEAKKITDKDVVAKVDADIVKAQANTAKIKTDLDVLGRLAVDPTVTADITKAQKALGTAETRLRALQGARAEMVVVADTTKAVASIKEVDAELAKVDGKSVFAKVGIKVDRAVAKGAAKDIGELAGGVMGNAAGKGLSAGIVGALVGLPIVGAAVGLGVAIAENLKSGLDGELNSDLLMARTDLNPKAAAAIGRAAGEAYANNFGPSIAENMDTARVAIQSGLLNPAAIEADSQAVIESLAGVSQILGEDIPAVSRSTAQLLRTGLAVDAAGAFDLLVRGTKAGLNVSQDMLDTVDEYSTQFRKLGLDGPQAFGLLSQAIKGGARDTDTAADAIKEFAIRAVDGSTTTTAGFKGLGLSAKTMADDIAAGGPRASAALGLTLDKLRAVEDPTKRATLAVDLFGTKAEDMGAALNGMNLSTAVAQLGNVKGAAKSAMDTLGDNTAGALASAQRNIEVATAGIKGALATAFAPQIKGFATFVTENRAAVMQFLLDLANGSIDAGRALVNAAASGTEGFGSMIGTVTPGLLSIIGMALKVGQAVAFAMDPTGVRGLRGAADQAVDSFNKWKPTAEAGAAAIASGSKTAADALRTDLIVNGLDPAQAKLKALADPMILKAGLHDASVALAKDIDSIGVAANGSKLKIDTHTGAVNTNTAAGKLLDTQIRAAVGSLDKEALAAAKSGESQKALTTRYGEGRQALITQLTQMGFTAVQAQKLADKYNAIPGKKVTDIILNKDVAAAKATAIQQQIDSIKQGKVPGLNANSAEGVAKIAALQRQIDALRGKNVTVGVTTNFSMGTGGANAFGFFTGGKDGGPVTGGTPHRDSVPRMLMPKEFIVREDGSNLGEAAAFYGHAPGMAAGGPVSLLPPPVVTREDQAERAFMYSLKMGTPPVAVPTGGGGGNAANRAIGRAMLAQFGWGADQWPPLDALWNKESGWSTTASNGGGGPDSGRAYGIPQSLPGSKMGTGFGGADWRTNPVTQERWGMGYIAGRYHNPAGAWAHSVKYNWYGDGGIIPPGGMALNEPNGKPERQLSGSQTEWFEAGRAAAGGGGADMSGVRADLAETIRILRSLAPGIGGAVVGGLTSAASSTQLVSRNRSAW